MTVCRTVFPYYNFSENRITFPVSVIKMCQKWLLNCAEMFSIQDIYVFYKETGSTME